MHRMVDEVRQGNLMSVVCVSNDIESWKFIESNLNHKKTSTREVVI